MTENTQELLSKAENALWAGDKRTAGILLHKVLLQDFNDAYAWRLLHAMLGSAQPFETFQISFALKYYPQKAHLLRMPTGTEPAVEPASEQVSEQAEAAQPAPPVAAPPPQPVVPALPAAQPIVEAIQPPVVTPGPLPPAPAKSAPAPEVELGHTSPLAVERLPYALLPDLSCPVCGKACPSGAKYCIYCGVPLETSPERPSGQGALLLYRPKANLAKDRIFSIWVDGKQVDQILDAEQRLLSLPSGPHTLVVKSAGRSSQPMQFSVRPGARVRLVCQAAKPTVRGAPPDLWVFPYYDEALYHRAVTGRERFWLAMRTLLIILLVSGLIGTIAYIAFYMAWN